MFRISLILVGAVSLFLGCSPSGPKDAASAKPTAPGSNRIFQVKGVIKELKPDGKTVQIRHEEVPDYMPAMSMPFTARDPKELTMLKPGDSVTFRMTVTETEVWIDQIQKVEGPTDAPNVRVATVPQGTNELSSSPTFRIVRDVDPLQIGDKLPEYHFTNELGQAVSTGDFRGQALAITFIFTRCPLPDFCPRMSSNFETVQKKLLSIPNSPTNWHLLTISFDPEVDKPAVLKSYSERFSADSTRWSFLTGDIMEISAISDQFGQKFWREEGAINHNLRTVVIDASGKVQQILTGNTWLVDDLVSELVRAAATK